MAAQVVGDAAAAGYGTAIEMASIFEPGFMRRARRRRRHLKRIDEAEVEATRSKLERDETRNRQKNWEDMAANLEKKTLHRLEHAKPTEMIVEDMERMAVDEMKLAEAAAYRERHKAETEVDREVKAQQQAAREVGWERRELMLV